VARRRRKGKAGKWVGRLLTLLLAIPAAYLAAALAGSLIAVNGRWTEPAHGATVYLADNGVHTDIIMPVSSEGLDWSEVLLATDVADPRPDTRWLAFGAGEEHIYLDTPRWSDITPATILAALSGGRRVMHVSYVDDPTLYAAREIRLRPEEYRRLWSSIRAEFALDAKGRPQHIAHLGYGCCDAFYRGVGKASAVRTCNSWVADRLKRAGVKASIWPPFDEGLTWRYRKARP
jgi:uncharacterized protein (TIGR02117 family)